MSQSASLEDLGFAEGDMVVLSVEGVLPSPAFHAQKFYAVQPARCGGSPPITRLQQCVIMSVTHAGRHAALARGHIHSVAADAVTVALGKALRTSLLTSTRRGPCGCWRIDRDEVASISVRLRRSVMGAPDPAERVFLCAGVCCTLLTPVGPRSPQFSQVWWRAGLFVRGDSHARKLRRLVVDLQSPVVGCVQRPGAHAPELNAEQLLAVNRCAALICIGTMSPAQPL